MGNKYRKMRRKKNQKQSVWNLNQNRKRSKNDLEIIGAKKTKLKNTKRNENRGVGGGEGGAYSFVDFPSHFDH